MAALTTLNLHFSTYNNPPTVDIADFLNAFPSSVKKFTLEYNTTKADEYNIHLNYIDTLGIKCESLDRTLADTISSSFPNLVHLELHTQITENICTTLPNPSFQKAKFDTTWANPCGMTFEAPNLVEPEHYYITEDDCILVEYNEILHLPVLTVVCFTEKILQFSDLVEILAI